MTIRAYVDTCVLSRTFDARISKKDVQAIEAILRRDDIELLTSRHTLNEFESTQNEKRRAALRLLYKIISKVPYEEMMIFTGGIGTSMLGATTFGGGGLVPNPLMSQLGQIFDDADAVHVFQASSAECSHFVTIDDALLERAVKARAELKELCPGLTICSLEELAAS